MPLALAIPQQGARIICCFLTKLGCKVDLTSFRKAVNEGGGYGMKVPCIESFTGYETFADSF